MSLIVEGVVEADGWSDALPEAEAWLDRAAQTLSANLGASPQPAFQGERQVTVLFADDARLAALNATFRGKNGPTNVLAFPAPPEAGTLGDIAIALETAQQEAADKGVSLAHHVAHLIVHGLLHLHGYDHDTDATAEAMERLEARVLARLGIDDPYRERV